MDFDNWRERIIEELEELADRGFQRKHWNAGLPDKIHSFDDLVSRLYDDFDFKGFVEKVQEHSTEAVAGSALQQFEARLSKYIDGLGFGVDDKKVIDDPEWISISSDAVVIVGIVKGLKNW